MAEGGNRRTLEATVRWVIYSHHDCDHSEGAQAFQYTVEEIIAHVNMPASAKRDMCVRIHSIP